jgi:hypothetical protein
MRPYKLALEVELHMCSLKALTHEQKGIKSIR